jgi:rare lipoprotein A
MKQSTRFLLLLGIAAFFGSGRLQAQTANPAVRAVDSLKITSVPIDSVETLGNLKFKLHKKKAHASYYSDKFNGRRTASGKKFNNNRYTAAHRKFPFGTKLRVTNEANGKCVIVEVIDRGPFSKGREIDLTKKAFMEIAHSRGIGSMVVTIEVVDKKEEN